jgi:hypothetical protein
MTLDQSVIYRRNDAGHFQQTGQGNKIAIFLIRGDVYRFVEGRSRSLEFQGLSDVRLA